MTDITSTASGEQVAELAIDLEESRTDSPVEHSQFPFPKSVRCTSATVAGLSCTGVTDE